MKIQIKDHAEGRGMNLVLPTRMLFSKPVLHLINGAGRKYAGDAMENISPEAMEAIFAELRRVKEKYGTWELVDIHAADGDIVKIVL